MTFYSMTRYGEIKKKGKVWTWSFPKGQPPLSVVLEHQPSLLKGKVSTLICNFVILHSQRKLQAWMSYSRFVTSHETLLLGPAVDGQPSPRLLCSSVGNKWKHRLLPRVEWPSHSREIQTLYLNTFDLVSVGTNSRSKNIGYSSSN